MIAALLLALLAAAPGGAPAPGPAHAPAEAALLRTAFPDHDPVTGFLGHDEGFLVDLTSACQEAGPCFLGVAARDAREPGRGHAWSTFFAFKPAGARWVEAGHVAGPAVDAVGRGSVRLSILVDRDGPFVTATATGGDGALTSTNLWSWEGTRFLPVLGVTSGRQGSAETEASFTLCADRPADRPSWEVRTREREGRGAWTESTVRVVWSGLAWVERPADRACGARPAVAAAAAPAPPAPARPGGLQVRSVSASKTAAAPKVQPRATGPGNAVDGDRQTAWVAGGKKGGVGEWLQVDLAAPTSLGSILLLGTCPGADWKAGPRLKKVRLRFEDGPSQEEALADSPSAQAIAVKRTAPTRWVRIELLEVYRGAKRQDACVTEVVPQAR